MNMELWWNDIFAGETEVLGENLPSISICNKRAQTMKMKYAGREERIWKTAPISTPVNF
jgi:hypothetical protein